MVHHYLTLISIRYNITWFSINRYNINRSWKTIIKLIGTLFGREKLSLPHYLTFMSTWYNCFALTRIRFWHHSAFVNPRCNITGHGRALEGALLYTTGVDFHQQQNSNVVQVEILTYFPDFTLSFYFYKYIDYFLLGN